MNPMEEKCSELLLHFFGQLPIAQFSVLFGEFFTCLLAKKRNPSRHGLRSSTGQATEYTTVFFENLDGLRYVSSDRMFDADREITTAAKLRAVSAITS